MDLKLFVWRIFDEDVNGTPWRWEVAPRSARLPGMRVYGLASEDIVRFGEAATREDATRDGLAYLAKEA